VARLGASKCSELGHQHAYELALLASLQKDLMRKCGTVLRVSSNAELIELSPANSCAPCVSPHQADVALTPADGRSRGFGVVLFSVRVARRPQVRKASLTGQ
jgi:alkylhydroperoxidase family enzyme